MYHSEQPFFFPNPLGEDKSGSVDCHVKVNPTASGSSHLSNDRVSVKVINIGCRKKKTFVEKTLPGLPSKTASLEIEKMNLDENT